MNINRIATYTKSALASVDGQKIIRSGVESSVSSVVHNASNEIGHILGKITVICIGLFIFWLFWLWLRGGLKEKFETDDIADHNNEPVARPRRKSRNDVMSEKPKHAKADVPQSKSEVKDDATDADNSEHGDKKQASVQ